MIEIRKSEQRGRFAIPDVFELVAAIALGYPGNPDDLSEDLRERELGERSRKPRSEFAFAGKWGVPLS